MTHWNKLALVRRQKLLELLPQYEWNIPKAALAAGYSRQYALTRVAYVVTKDVDFCRALNQKYKEISAKSTDDVELCKKKMREIVESPKSKASDIARAADILCRIAGVFSEKRIIEDATRQRELDQAERREAEQLALLRFKQVG